MKSLVSVVSRGSTAQEVFDDAFSSIQHRDPRSPEYKDGVLAALRFRFKETDGLKCPYEVGTAAADAFYSGTDEGLFLARSLLGVRA